MVSMAGGEWARLTWPRVVTSNRFRPAPTVNRQQTCHEQRSDHIHNKLDGLTGFFSSLAGALPEMVLMLIEANWGRGPDQGGRCASSQRERVSIERLCDWMEKKRTRKDKDR